jgi:hypothetical protein
MIGDYKEVHKDDDLNVYSSSSIIRRIKSRRMRWAGHVARLRKKRNACRLLVGKIHHENRRIYMDNIKMHLRMVWYVLD